jgi:asparagine synthase (glutamine-hydrolysing)
MPDEDVPLAKLAADHLGIPWEATPADGYGFHEARPELDCARPYPGCCPFDAVSVDQRTAISKRFRVALTGHGGDVILRQDPAYAQQLVKTRDLGTLAKEVVRGVRFGQLRGSGLATALGLRRRREESGTRHPPVPAWLRAMPRGEASLRPGTEALLLNDSYSRMFDVLDSEQTRFAIEERHPLFDLRVVEYMLSIPPITWCADKLILREAMRGRLPEAVRRHPKVRHPHDAVLAHLAVAPQFQWEPLLPKDGALDDVVDPGGLVSAVKSYARAAPWEQAALVRAVEVARWLAFRNHFPNSTIREEAA